MTPRSRISARSLGCASLVALAILMTGCRIRPAPFYYEAVPPEETWTENADLTLWGRPSTPHPYADESGLSPFDMSRYYQGVAPQDSSSPADEVSRDKSSESETSAAPAKIPPAESSQQASTPAKVRPADSLATVVDEEKRRRTDRRRSREHTPNEPADPAKKTRRR